MTAPATRKCPNDTLDVPQIISRRPSRRGELDSMRACGRVRTPCEHPRVVSCRSWSSRSPSFAGERHFQRELQRFRKRLRLLETQGLAVANGSGCVGNATTLGWSRERGVEVRLIEAPADLGVGQRQSAEVAASGEPVDRCLVESQARRHAMWLWLHRVPTLRTAAALAGDVPSAWSRGVAAPEGAAAGCCCVHARAAPSQPHAVASFDVHGPVRGAC